MTRNVLVRYLLGFRAVLIAAPLLVSCQGDTGKDKPDGPPLLLPSMLQPAVPANNAEIPPPSVPFSSATPRVIARAVRSWPHDPQAYTQGLVVHAGGLLESTGLEGRSDVREVDLATGRVRRRTPLPAGEFGEGIAVLGQRIYQVTWLSGRGHVYDLKSLAPIDSFTYSGEGWGLATDGRVLYMSDGTSTIRILDPESFRVLRTIQVLEAGRAVHGLNEMEWVKGELWANVYQTDFIARIDVGTGRILGWINLAELLMPEERRYIEQKKGVANGIAYDVRHDRVVVTGKYWPRVFHISVQ